MTGQAGMKKKKKNNEEAITTEESRVRISHTVVKLCYTQFNNYHWISLS